MNTINWNGICYDKAKPILDISNRAFRYGDGFFETVYYSKGIMPLWSFHVSRIESSLQILDMGSLQEDLLLEINKLIPKIAKTYRIRLTFVRRAGGFYAPTQQAYDFLIEASVHEDSLWELSTKTYNFGICEGVRLVADNYSGLKRTAALPYVMAAHQAQREGWDEVLLRNSEGRLCEASRGNIFYLDKNNTWHTPPLSEACVAGVCRASILQAMPNVLQTPIDTTDWAEAKAAFVSNALRGLQPLDVGSDKNEAYKQIKKIHSIWCKALTNNV
ncbi:MAG: aminotransferase class IV [Bernardetiaceae bacterium]|nr:aminotransferase class IV [Bernardetiaceae bacterium]